MKVPLKIERGNSEFRVAMWRESEPFVENSNGRLIHRPRAVSIIKLATFTPHMAITYWCGNHATGKTKFTFLAAPPEGKLVCIHCEMRAFMAGQPSSSELAGHHVCLGRIKVINCCPLHGEKL